VRGRGGGRERESTAPVDFEKRRTPMQTAPDSAPLAARPHLTTHRSCTEARLHRSFQADNVDVNGEAAPCCNR
jgi:hypothetical protein